ncbi:aldo/keto reductase, partial [Candidatus Pelagibacter ubique]|nr:aldo/keto reductase [Candidatus Pelagibacter ubique]
ANQIKIKSRDIKNILKLAKNNNINKIDTAEDYLKDKKIFKNISKTFKFSSKILLDIKWTSLEFCQMRLEKHLNNLNNKKIQTLLIHNEKILFSKNGKKIFKNLENLKNKKYFQKIGLSIYSTDCLDYIVSNFDINVVQCPYNILDKRILTSGWFDKLKNKKIETHIRSIFLQGLLVNQSVYKKQYFKKWQNKLSNWFVWLENNNISPVDYCLSDVMYNDFDNIVIGINSFDNLKEIINFKKIDVKKLLNLKINDLKLIDPRRWK